MAADERLAVLETIFKALSDRTRVRILGLLRAGEICVCDIHETLGMPQPTVSRHLAYLRKAGLVTARKDGLWVHYTLARRADPVMQSLLDAVTHAIGHLDSGERDQQRLAARVACAPVEAAPRSGCCC